MENFKGILYFVIAIVLTSAILGIIKYLISPLYLKDEVKNLKVKVDELEQDKRIIKQEYDDYKKEKEWDTSLVVDKTKAEREQLMKRLSKEYSKELKELERKKK